MGDMPLSTTNDVVGRLDEVAEGLGRSFHDDTVRFCESADRQNKIMIRMTKAIVFLTVAMSALVLVQIFISF